MEVVDSTRPLCGYGEIAQFLGFHFLRVVILVKVGNLPHFKHAGRIHAHRDALLQWTKNKRR